MDESDHEASIVDVKYLANSLKGKIDTLHPLSGDCCIYRVPPDVRTLNERLYNPRLVSIGPFHHGRTELKAMEEHKIRYLRYFLARTRVSMEEFLVFIKVNETRLRNCYAETIAMGRDKFVEMILVDAVFLIEMFLRWSKPGFRTSDDRICGKQKLIFGLKNDILYLENQIPLFIIEDLFELAKTQDHGMHCQGISLRQLTYEFCRRTRRRLRIEKNLCLKPPDVCCESKHIFPIRAPSITQLHQAGVKFRVGSTNNLLNIRFSNGTLVIPSTLNISNFPIIRNVQIFERLHDDTVYINDYVTLMHDLVNTAKDEEVLIANGFTEDRTWDYVGMSTLFGDLRKERAVACFKFYYTDLVKDLNDYCKSPYNRWKANLKQNYFNTPWVSISVVGAIILLLLTLTQAVCSVIAL